jgi:CXXX repeat peptide maturase
VFLLNSTGMNMERIQHLWILLADDATACCNEPPERSHQTGAAMAPELFAEIVGMVREHSWRCSIVANQKGMPAAYRALLDQREYDTFVPPDCSDAPEGTRTTVVFDGTQAARCGGMHAGAKALLRAQRGDLGQLGATVVGLLGKYAEVSIRHPELLSYGVADLETYKRQLFEIGDWLLSKGADWPKYHIDQLTGSFGAVGLGECGSGNTSLAAGPDGHLYFCPAAFYSGAEPCGCIPGTVNLPNRHLFTRHYSLPCRDRCMATHCSRCVYLNKIATYEFCVPAENLCRLAHIELEAQACLARSLVERGVWDTQKAVPAPPSVYDPYDLIKDNLGHAPGDEDVWSRLTRFTGRAPDLSPPLMLDMIHALQGRLEALRACLQAGCVPPGELVESDPLVYCRRKTVERYGNVVFTEDGLTIGQVEQLMHRAAQTSLEDALGADPIDGREAG